jgi:hypothetical protein
MLLPKEVTELMGQKVKYCRAKPDEKGQPELHRGQGVIVGIIIGVTRRVQIMVKDEDVAADKAWTLDLMCVNPSEADAQRYFEHHKNLRRMVDEHNAAQKQREADKIKEVDEINYAMFGQPLEI